MILAGVLALQARAATVIPAITATAPSFAWNAFGGAASGATVGWSFQVGSSDLSVTDVGLFEGVGTGFVDPHELGIWDNLGNPLLNVTIPTGTVATLDGSYRFLSVTPLVLSAGSTYVIGALYPVQSGDNVVFAASGGVSSNLAFLESRSTPLSSVPTFAYPNANPGAANGVFGPNFMYTVNTSVPEPSTWLLTITALAGIASSRRFRRK
jgi:hypothetical protein